MPGLPPPLRQTRPFGLVEWAIAISIGILLIGLIVPTASIIDWVGSRDVLFVIRVINAETGQPIQGAKVSLIDEFDDGPSRLVTDSQGMIQFTENRTSAGRDGPFVHTFSVDIPGRIFWVEASDYTRSGIMTLSDFRHLVRHFEKTSELVVTIPLNRKTSRDPKR